MIIDNIGQTTLVNGIVRIQAMKVQPGGEQVPSGEIEIPAVIAGPILDAIVGSVKELENQIIRFGVNVPSILNDPGALFGWESPPSLPATYVLDPEGKLIHTLIGPQTQESLETLIGLSK